MMPLSMLDATNTSVARLRILVLEAEGSALNGDRAEVLQRVAAMRDEVVNVSSEHGTFRQLWDIGLLEVDVWAGAGDLAAAATTLDDLRALLASLESRLDHA
jgi:hypothetical protein